MLLFPSLSRSVRLGALRRCAPVPRVCFSSISAPQDPAKEAVLSGVLQDLTRQLEELREEVQELRETVHELQSAAKHKVGCHS